MENGVFLESTVINMRPQPLNLLYNIINKAKETFDYVVSFRKKDLANEFDKDVRTITRYLKELEDNAVIQTKGKKGRSGGTIVSLNTDKIRFNTSDNALVNTQEDVDLDETVKEKFPKQKEDKPNKRYRRTKREMVEDQILHNQVKEKNDYLNEKIKKTNGVPTWDLFKETENPIRNYRIYLLTRMYNRYAVLFTDYNNAEAKALQLPKDQQVAKLPDTYDVMSQEFFGSSVWNQFGKFYDFCENNNIDPAVYFSAQFNRTIYMKSKVGKGKLLPFVNALTSDASYEVYKEYCSFQKRTSFISKTSSIIPAQFTDDFVIVGIREAYETAHKDSGILQHKAKIESLFSENNLDEEEITMTHYYDIIKKDLRKNNISLKSRDTIKKFIILQTLTLAGEYKKIPDYLALGSGTTHIMLKSIEHPSLSEQETRSRKSHALGKLVNPNPEHSTQDQIENGRMILTKFLQTRSIPFIFRLIMQRKGLYFSLQDLREAFNEYGKEKVPVDDYSLLDVDQIVKYVKENYQTNQSSYKEIDLDQITEKQEYKLIGSVREKSFMDDPIAYLYGEDVNIQDIM